MTVAEAVARIQKLIPGQKITGLYEYDNRRYLVVAPRSVDPPDYNDPYYLYNKSTGALTDYRPTADIAAFGRIVRTGRNLLKGG